MGVGTFYCGKYDGESLVSVNPDPGKFDILERHLSRGGAYTALLVHYKGCSNFEGWKLLIMEGDHTDTVYSSLDPHFAEGSDLVARFSPDDRGLKLASVMFGFEQLKKKERAGNDH